MSLPPKPTRPGITNRIPNPHYDPALDWRDQAIRALEKSRGALANWKISRPGTAASLIPVIGPAWEAAADIQEGDYGSAAFNGAMAVVDVLPGGQLVKMGRVAKLLSAANKGKPLSSLNARQMRARYAKAGLIKSGEELHHTVPLRDWKILPKADRNAAGVVRNSPLLLKVMDPAAHKLAHGKAQGLDRVRQVWHGSNALEKSVVGAGVAKTADAGEAWMEGSRPILDPNVPLDVKRTEQGFIIQQKR